MLFYVSIGHSGTHHTTSTTSHAAEGKRKLYESWQIKVLSAFMELPIFRFDSLQKFEIQSNVLTKMGTILNARLSHVKLIIIDGATFS